MTIYLLTFTHMSNNSLHIMASKLMAKGRGLLAADESNGTCDKRFEVYGITTNAETRRAWRELLFTTPEIERGLSGVILFDETIRQNASSGKPFVEVIESRGILAGIKVDQKTKPLPNSPLEEVTDGLLGLKERLSEYAKMGAKFTKWRAVIHIGEKLPTTQCLLENAKRMTEYAFESQQAGLVPIVEPEVLLNGTHTAERCEAVIKETMSILFTALAKSKVDLKGLILKTSMVLPGKDSGQTSSAKEIAGASVRVLKASVPAEVAGIVFLSGGQTPIQAVENLNEMAKIPDKPWPLTFSYSRALQDPVMKAWAGKEENLTLAQEIFRRRVLTAAAASEGCYRSAMEVE